MTIGERIKRIRTERGLSQEDLAFKIGLTSRSGVCRLETSGDNITRKNIDKVARALNVHPSVLLGWDDADYSVFLQDDDNVSFLLESVPKKDKAAYYTAIYNTINALNSVNK